MSPTLTFIAALIVLAIAGLVAWAGFALSQVEVDLRSFSGFEGMHLEAEPHALPSAE